MSRKMHGTMDDPLAWTEHRPWAMPRGPWAMQMTWQDLLFAHWPVPVAALRPRVPEALSLDTFEGSAWLAVTPFVMTDVAPRGWPTIAAWRFCELNVRTYVTVEGKPGVYFFSLDAANALAVRAARWSWGLPYYVAEMSHHHEADGWIAYSSTRTHHNAPAASLAARYRPSGDAQPAAAGSFEHFAMERYCLYTVDAHGRAVRGETHHAPWALQPAEAQWPILQMTEQIDVTLPDVAPRLHFAERMHVVAWLPYRV